MNVTLTGLVGGGAAAVFGACLTLLQYLHRSSLSPLEAIGSRLLGMSGAPAWLGGGFFFLLGGGLVAILLSTILRWLNADSLFAGAAVGFGFWYIASLLLAPFPALDIWTAPGIPAVGPLGMSAGVPTFSILLVAHAALGMIVARMMRGDQRRGSAIEVDE